jgi:hypothetical protein
MRLPSVSAALWVVMYGQVASRSPGAGAAPGRSPATVVSGAGVYVGVVCGRAVWTVLVTVCTTVVSRTRSDALVQPANTAGSANTTSQRRRVTADG